MKHLEDSCVCGHRWSQHQVGGGQRRPCMLCSCSMYRIDDAAMQQAIAKAERKRRRRRQYGEGFAGLAYKLLGG